MAGIKKIYEFGVKGVNLTDVPFELDDSEVLTATNVEPSQTQRKKGLRKRGGMTKVNASAINSGASIGGVYYVSPDSFTTDTLYAGLEASAGSNTWRTSTNGTSWGFVTSPEKPQQASKVELSATIDMVNQRCVTYKNKLYYPGNDYTIGTSQPYIMVFDGTTATRVATIPKIRLAYAQVATSFVTDMYVFRERIYIATYDIVDTTSYGRVLEFNPETGEILQLGPEFSSSTTQYGMPWCLCGFQGRLWVSTYIGSSGGTGKLLSIIPGAETTWTTEYTAAAGWIPSMTVYRGDLYFGRQVDSGATATILKFSTGWINTASMTATSDTGPSGAAAANYDTYNGLIVFDDALYATYYHTGGSPAFLIRKFDGSSWSTDYNIESNHAGRKYTGQALVWNNALYYVIAEPGGSGTPHASTGGLILRKPSGGAWSKVDDISARGFLGSIQA